MPPDIALWSNIRRGQIETAAAHGVEALRQREFGKQRLP
jgi:hypothetical protein